VRRRWHGAAHCAFVRAFYSITGDGVSYGGAVDLRGDQQRNIDVESILLAFISRTLGGGREKGIALAGAADTLLRMTTFFGALKTFLEAARHRIGHPVVF